MTSVILPYDLVNLQITGYKMYGFSFPKTKRLAAELFDMNFISYPKRPGIRPTAQDPDTSLLSEDQLRIYRLIAEAFAKAGKRSKGQVK